MREVAWGDKPCLRKSTDRKAQTRKNNIGKQKKREQKMRFELKASPSLPTWNTMGRAHDSRVEARFLGSIHVRVNWV